MSVKAVAALAALYCLSAVVLLQGTVNAKYVEGHLKTLDVSGANPAQYCNSQVALNLCIVIIY